MNRSRDIDRILDRWMDDGPSVVVDRVIAGAMTNNLGNAAANHAKLWRKGTLLLGVIGLAELDTFAELESDELRPVAEEMNSRSR